MSEVDHRLRDTTFSVRERIEILVTGFVAAALFACVSTPGPDGPFDTNAAEVRSCRPLGEVLGESSVCNQYLAMESTRGQANALGATHIVWTNVRCVVFVGEKASARIFDCAPDIALDDVFENYLARDNDLATVTAPSDEPAEVMMSSDLDADTEDMTLRGYALVGYAAASGSAIRLDAIRERANSLRAETVLVHTKSTGVDVEYQAVTIYSRGGVGVGFTNAWGSGTHGFSTVNATTFMLQPGISQTEFVPFSKRRFQTQALFWRRRLPGPFGMFTARIPLTLRTSLQRNTGAFVFAVEDDSPAFFANVLAGDVVIGLDGEEVRTPSELAIAASRKASATVVLQLLRGGETLNVSVETQQSRLRK